MFAWHFLEMKRVYAFDYTAIMGCLSKYWESNRKL